MSLHHRFDGPPDAPVVVLGPSLGTNLGLWEPQLPDLTRSWRVLRYDLPGHGGSPARSGFSVEDLAAEVLTLLDSYDLGTVSYAGVSYGAAIGATVAAAAPDRIAALVLCCTAARFGTPEAWHERAALVRREGTDAVAATAPGRWFTFRYEDPEPYVAMLRGTDAESYAACCEALAGFDLRDRLGEIAAPTLVIAGAEDMATPAGDARLLAAGIPAAGLLVVPEAAHLANVERPEEVTPAILDHLEKHG